MQSKPTTQLSAIEELIKTMAYLRSPEAGCPWDREQTHATLKKYLIEEAYEVLEAIDSESDRDLLEELGDLLLQVCFHAQIAAEREAFNFNDIAKRVDEKMKLRHPHVFEKQNPDIKTGQDVAKQWEAIKAAEKSHLESPFDGIPKFLPSLARAVKVLKKAEKLKLSIEESFQLQTSKVTENALSQITTEDELASFLLQVSHHAKKLKLDPEEALRKATAKIQKEFEEKLK